MYIVFKVKYPNILDVELNNSLKYFESMSNSYEYDLQIFP